METRQRAEKRHPFGDMRARGVLLTPRAMLHLRKRSVLGLSMILVACGTRAFFDAPGSTESALEASWFAHNLPPGSADERAVLALVNDRHLSADAYVDRCDFARLVSLNIVSYRDGDDLADTRDDQVFDNIAELDALPFTDRAFFLAAKACVAAPVTPVVDAGVPVVVDASDAGGGTFPTDPSLKDVDVTLVIDTTGSMGGALENLRTAFDGTIIDSVRARIPNVAFSVVGQGDYPVGGFGSPGDLPVNVRQITTNDRALVKTALLSLVAAGGGDGPEAQIVAMQHALTGEAITWTGGSIPAHTPAVDTTGAVELRKGALPVVVLVTDALWHSETESPYGFPAPTMVSLTAAFQATHAKFISLTPESSEVAQADALSDATASALSPAALADTTLTTCAPGQCCTGVNGAGIAPAAAGGNCRLNFRYAGSGTGLSTSLVRAIDALSRGTTFSAVRAEIATPTPRGASSFVKAIRAVEEGNASQGCVAASAIDTNGDGIREAFVGLGVRSRVCFAIVAQPDPAASVARVETAVVRVLGTPGDVELDRRTVTYVVPAGR